jgi:hypothetical protein
MSSSNSGGISFTQRFHNLAVGNSVGPVFGWVTVGLNTASLAFVNLGSVSIVLTISHGILLDFDNLYIVMLVGVAGTTSFVLAFPNAGILVWVGIEHGQVAALGAFKGFIHG